MFNTGYNPTSNMGFGSRFKLNEAYSPTLANANYAPGMVDLSQPMPTPMGGAAPNMVSTANAIGGGSVAPGAAGSMSPGNLSTSWPGMNNPMQQQTPAGGAGDMSPSATMALAQLGGGLLNQSQPTTTPPGGQALMGGSPMPASGVSGQNGALQRLLSMYGIQGGLLGG